MRQPTFTFTERRWKSKTRLLRAPTILSFAPEYLTYAAIAGVQ